jgi:hypothetical protein
MASTLLAHIDTRKVGREELAAIPLPEATSTFKPVPHIELIETLGTELAIKGITIEKEEFAVRADGSRLFSTFDLSINGIDGSQAALGLRTANDRSMSITMVAGLRVFVCDNLALQGDMIALRRKHTSGLSLREEVRAAIENYLVHYGHLKTEVAMLAGKVLADVEAKALIHDAFMLREMPMRYLPEVSHQYFEPTHEEFKARTAWSLHNAFTEVAKQMPMTTRMEAVTALGRFFGLTLKGE